MKEKVLRIALVIGTLVFSGTLAYTQQSQQPDHAQMNHSGADKPKTEETAIFCPTMKTGQLCTEGTTNVLHLTGEQQQQWLAMARKYNHAVDAATVQLLKDSEGTLNPEQQKMLKAWFAVGLNPEINQLLYTKGLGPQPKP
jgi:hypothetical protein